VLWKWRLIETTDRNIQDWSKWRRSTWPARNKTTVIHWACTDHALGRHAFSCHSFIECCFNKLTCRTDGRTDGRSIPEHSVVPWDAYTAVVSLVQTPRAGRHAIRYIRYLYPTPSTSKAALLLRRRRRRRRHGNTAFNVRQSGSQLRMRDARGHICQVTECRAARIRSSNSISRFD